MKENKIPEEYRDKFKAVSDFIREYRKQMGYSQQELADLINDTHRRTIVNAESGRKNFSVLTLIKIWDGLGINPFVDE